MGCMQQTLYLVLELRGQNRKKGMKWIHNQDLFYMIRLQIGNAMWFQHVFFVPPFPLRRLAF